MYNCKLRMYTLKKFYDILKSLKYNVIELNTVHTTAAGKERKTLKSKARKLKQESKLAERVARYPSGLLADVATLMAMAENAAMEAQELKDAARLEDIHLWTMEKTKTTNKGDRSYTYWMASWREGEKVRNSHIGSTRKMTEEEALTKAKKLKAAALGIEPDKS
jgi:regulator of replication initiation timing